LFDASPFNGCLRRHRKERTRTETLGAQPDFISSTPSVEREFKQFEVAVLGRRVRLLIDSYAGQGVHFFAAGVAFDDVEKY